MSEDYAAASPSAQDALFPLPDDYVPPQADDFARDLLSLVDQFGQDMAFTAPEMFGMRFRFFREAVEDLLEEYE